MRDILDIGEVAKRSGVRVSALRYYEEKGLKGLIASVGRRGLHRLFRESVLYQLSLIALARIAGFSLDETAKMFPANGQITINRENLLMKADEMELSIKRLSAMRDGLRHVARCPMKNQLDCPKFQRLVTMAGKAQFKSGAKKKKAQRSSRVF
jgi:DNA-binding transcriptional MerR regulator